MNDRIRRFTRITATNGKELLLFLTVFRLLVILLFIRLFSICVDLALKLTSYSFVTPQNLPRFITSPFMLASILLLMLLLF